MEEKRNFVQRRRSTICCRPCIRSFTLFFVLSFLSQLSALSTTPNLVGCSIKLALKGYKSRVLKPSLTASFRLKTANNPRRVTIVASLSSNQDSSTDVSDSLQAIRMDNTLGKNSLATHAESATSVSDGFGKSVPYVPLNQRNLQVSSKTSDPSSFSNSPDEIQMLQKKRARNVAVAIASFLIAIFNYAWQLTHPVTAVEILATMQSHSAPLTAIGNNGKPTVIDFWAEYTDRTIQP